MENNYFIVYFTYYAFIAKANRSDYHLVVTDEIFPRADQTIANIYKDFKRQAIQLDHVGITGIQQITKEQFEVFKLLRPQ